VPQVIPPFDQYQAPVIPLRGLWNKAPAEGDMFATFEIDWMITTQQRAVQIAFNANSPVAFSQIAALAVDNRRSGYDVDFVFPDSNFTVTVPAYTQTIFPVFTNAMMFYAVAAEGVVAGNVTVFQVLNSIPPPLQLNPTAMQTANAVNAVQLHNGATAQVIPPGISGTLNGFLITINFAQTLGATLELIDGAGTVLWADGTAGTTGNSQIIQISGLHVRFVNGVQLVVSGVSVPDQAQANVNLFYTTP
jgi:hypothetical protein